MPAPEPSGPGIIKRRTLLDAVLGFGFIATAVSFLYPVWRFLIPPASSEATTSSVVAGSVADFPPNSGAVLKFGVRPAILVRTPDGQFRAFNAICTHLDCTVQYRPDTSQIWCACHNGFYDLAGQVTAGPPPRPLEQFAVNLRGEPGSEEVVISRL